MPVPAILQAAEALIEALELHICGDTVGAEACLIRANDKTVWAYTNQAWGKGSASSYGLISVANAPPYLAVSERPKPRMPGTETRKAMIARDGYHCRFCGIPVVNPDIRKLLVKTYPAAVNWGLTNAAQHAAFQCMWLQFDHILPNSRGGDSSLENMVVTCAPCNFGRMEATLEEARLINPLSNPVPVIWGHHAEWDGLERFRKGLHAGS